MNRRADQNVPVHRLDYRPPDFGVERIHLDFDLDPASTMVSAQLSLVRHNPSATVLELDGEGLELLQAHWIDGIPADYEVHETGLTLQWPEIFGDGPRVLQTVVRIGPESNSSLSGLYTSGDLLVTQCEAEGFRRITFMLDRPDVMARYTVRLVADRERYPVLLANGNLIESGDWPDQRKHYSLWDDPFPKPSYLFAIVAGKLVARESRIKTQSGREALLQVWSSEAELPKTEHAMTSLIHSIRWDEKRYGLELDLDRFMIVAATDFNMGAMENKGLNVFNSKYVLADAEIATDTDFLDIEAVVGHEYFHNWTGNRVTCRDWFQLTLKEGLTVFRDQEFTSDRLAEQVPPASRASARAVKRIDDVRVLRASQFPEDSGPMAHPIRPDEYRAIDNFYTVTVYEKGAEVVRMLQTLLGQEGFAHGLKTYLTRHDGQAVTCDDFLNAMFDAQFGAEESAEKARYRRFAHWYSQAGTPRVEVRDHYDSRNRRYELRFKQKLALPRQQAFLIPITLALLGEDGALMHLHEASQQWTGQTEATFCFDDMEASLTFENIPSKPVPSLLRSFSAPVIIEYDFSEADLVRMIRFDTDPFNRWEAAQRLMIEYILASYRKLTDRSLEAGPLPDLGNLVGALHVILADEALDPAFCAQVMSLPAESFLLEQIDSCIPSMLRQARDHVRDSLTRGLSGLWLKRYSMLHQIQPYSPDPASAGRRALCNLALQHLTKLEALSNPGGVPSGELARQHWLSANNMTDRIAALAAVIDSSASCEAEILEAFADRYQHEPLAMDKWLSLQAMARSGSQRTLDRVRQLMNHPSFDAQNPNRVRALIGSFFRSNLAEFHSPDGEAYAFWAEQVIERDRTNPHVASALARTLDRWPKFEPQLAQAMLATIRRVADHRSLSDEVREIIDRQIAIADPSPHHP